MMAIAVAFARLEVDCPYMRLRRYGADSTPPLASACCRPIRVRAAARSTTRWPAEMIRAGGCPARGRFVCPRAVAQTVRSRWRQIADRPRHAPKAFLRSAGG
jgi:hypothetical protein